MGAYSQNRDSVLARQNLIAAAGDSQFDITDTTAQFWPQDVKINIADLVNKIADDNYTRFGCFVYSPTNIYDGIVLAIPKAPSGDGPYSTNDLLALGVAVNSAPGSLYHYNVQLILLSGDISVISAAASKNNWQCGRSPNGVKISQPPKSP